MPASTGATGSGALVGWRVLEIADGVSASFCSKVLSDLGAEVMKVEPQGGHSSRIAPPRRSDAAPEDPGGRFVYLNTGKSSVVVGDGPERDADLDRLAGFCDVVVTDDLAWVERNALPPRVIEVVVTPWGATGPARRWRATHLVSFHAAGEGSILPSGPGWLQFPDRPPLQLGSEIAHFDAGWNAAVAALAAMYDRLRTGVGQRIDVSAQESELTLNRTRLSRFNNDGVVLRRDGGRYGTMGMIGCRDGWVQLVGMTPDQWDALARSADAGELSDPAIATRASRAENPELAAAAIKRWCEGLDSADIVRILSSLGAPVGAYATTADLQKSEQLAHRGFFRAVDDRRGGQILLPGPPYRLSKTPVIVGPPPAVGTAFEFRSSGPGSPSMEAGRVLAGVRILDFTWAAAGPYATALLAFLGADVVKVESTRRPDPARRGFLADYGGINCSPNFNELNLNKRSFQVDLTQPDGLALGNRLVEWADVVVDNFRPGVMARFGFDATALVAKRPDLIVASSSANGSTGPDALAAGLASIFGATGGLSEQTGYEDGPPTEIGESTDYRSGNALAVGILAALLHKAQTGEGQVVDVSSREVVIASAPDAFLAQQLGVVWQPRIGNGHREHAPHGVYRAAGTDEWIAIAVVDEQSWSGLCQAMGADDLIDRYPTAQSRRLAAGEIDAAVGRWTSQHSPQGLGETLQARGVPATAVMTNEMLASDPHLAERNVFVEINHPEIGRSVVMRPPWRFSGLEFELRHGPLIGEHNDEVLTGILGLGAHERHSLNEVLL